MADYLDPQVASETGHQAADLLVPPTPAEAQQAALQAKYGGVVDQIGAGTEGLAQALTFGLSTPIETHLLGVKPEDIAGREAANPWSHGIGTTVGIAAPFLAGPLGIGKGIAELTAPKLIGRLGTTVAENLTPKVTSPLLRTAISGTLAGATEGAAYGLGNAIHEESLGDPSRSASAILTDSAGDIFYGAAGGAVLGGIGSAGIFGAKAAKTALTPWLAHLEEQGLQEQLGLKSSEVADFNKSYKSEINSSNFDANVLQDLRDNKVITPLVTPRKMADNAADLAKRALADQQTLFGENASNATEKALPLIRGERLSDTLDDYFKKLPPENHALQRRIFEEWAEANKNESDTFSLDSLFRSPSEGMSPGLIPEIMRNGGTVDFQNAIQDIVKDEFPKNNFEDAKKWFLANNRIKLAAIGTAIAHVADPAQVHGFEPWELLIGFEHGLGAGLATWAARQAMKVPGIKAFGTRLFRSFLDNSREDILETLAARRASFEKADEAAMKSHGEEPPSSPPTAPSNPPIGPSEPPTSPASGTKPESKIQWEDYGTLGKQEYNASHGTYYKDPDGKVHFYGSGGRKNQIFSTPEAAEAHNANYAFMQANNPQEVAASGIPIEQASKLVTPEESEALPKGSFKETKESAKIPWVFSDKSSGKAAYDAPYGIYFKDDGKIDFEGFQGGVPPEKFANEAEAEAHYTRHMREPEPASSKTGTTPKAPLSDYEKSLIQQAGLEINKPSNSDTNLHKAPDKWVEGLIKKYEDIDPITAGRIRNLRDSGIDNEKYHKLLDIAEDIHDYRDVNASGYPTEEELYKNYTKNNPTPESEEYESTPRPPLGQIRDILSQKISKTDQFVPEGVAKHLASVWQKVDPVVARELKKNALGLTLRQYDALVDYYEKTVDRLSSEGLIINKNVHPMLPGKDFDMPMNTENDPKYKENYPYKENYSKDQEPEAEPENPQNTTSPSAVAVVVPDGTEGVTGGSEASAKRETPPDTAIPSKRPTSEGTLAPEPKRVVLRSQRVLDKIPASPVKQLLIGGRVGFPIATIDDAVRNQAMVKIAETIDIARQKVDEEIRNRTETPKAKSESPSQEREMGTLPPTMIPGLMNAANQVRTLANSPEAMLNLVTNYTNNFSNLAPQTAQAASSQLNTLIQALAKLAPENVSLGPLSAPLPPPKSALIQWADALDVARDPASYIMTHPELVRQLYPSYMSNFVEPAIYQNMLQHQTEGNPYSYQQKLMLSQVVQQDLTGDLAVAQQMNIQQQQQSIAQTPMPKLHTSNLGKIQTANRLRTSTQSLMTGKKE